MHASNSGEPGAQLFAALRRVERPVADDTTDRDVAIQIAFDEEGAYLEVVDPRGRPRTLDYRLCRGALRDLLKALDSVRRQSESIVGWEDTSGRVYLHAHGHLLWLLRECGVLIDESLRPVTFVPGVVDLVLHLKPEPHADATWLRGEILLLRDGERLADTGRFRFVNETHVLIDDRLYETPPVGENFRALPLFAEAIPPTLLERCLSLLFSQFAGVTVRYENYRTVAGEDLPAQPAILFQKVDDSGALHFDLAYTLPGFPINFVREHDITRAVLLNEAERALVVRNVLYGSLAEERQELTRRLNRHQKALEPGTAAADALLYADENGFILGCRLAETFLARELGDLVRRYALFGAEQLKTYRVRPVTALGEFALDLRETVDLAKTAPARATIELDDMRLLATCRQVDALTALALGQFMEKVSDARYRMTHKSLLGGCTTRPDLEERIRLFRRVVCAQPPPIWERFMEKALASIAPLNLEPDWLVFKLASDENLRHLLATEPTLRALTIKVEGLRIAVKRSDLRKLLKRLEHFGYLTPIPDLSGR